MRKAEIYYKDVVAGLLMETDEGDYVFQYNVEYIERHMIC